MIKPESFRPTKDVRMHLACVYDKSKFINRSIHFYLIMLHRPMQILKEIKNLHPKLYKFVGRKKF